MTDDAHIGKPKIWATVLLGRSYMAEVLVLHHSDEIVLKNIDALMEMALPLGHIAAGHTCTCNPRKSQRYPKDW